jgi:GTPase SAR1 family protein
MVDPRAPAAVLCCSGLSQRERAGLPPGNVAAFSLVPASVPLGAAAAAVRPQGRAAALSSTTGASLAAGAAAPAASILSSPVIPPLPVRNQPTWFGGDPSAAKNPRRTLKLVLSGDAGVGKTPLLHRLRTSEFYAAGGSTCSYESSTLCVSLEAESTRDSVRDTAGKGARETVRLAIWDTAGVDGAAAALLRAPYEQAAGCLLCFDVTERSSFVALERRLLRLQEWSGAHVPAVVAGLKTDRAASRKVPLEEAQAWAAERGLPYVEASSCSGEGVWEVLWTLVHVANAAARGRESSRVQPAAAAAAAIAATLGAAASAGEDGRAAAAALSATFGAAASAVAGRKATATAAAIAAIEGGKGSAASAASAAAAAVSGFLGSVTGARNGAGGAGDGVKSGPGAGATAAEGADAGAAAEAATGASGATLATEAPPGSSSR